MSDNRTFRLYDTSLSVSTTTNEKQRYRGYEMAWNRPDWEAFNRIMKALEAVGFTFGDDPQIAAHYPSLNKSHRLGQRNTPGGALFVSCETYPTGCKFEFFQELVTVNKNGGRYDFDKRSKMPYLIRKAFELAIRAARAHLIGRGFSETTKVESPNPDPLAFFNQQWDGDYERRRGAHRFKRDETGWPSVEEIGKACWGVTEEHPLMRHGEVRYFRDRSGRLMRCRVYGGINGMWMAVYGPGPRDCTHLHCSELRVTDPRGLPRKLHPQAAKRLNGALNTAVQAQNFERAIVLRDTLARKAA